MSGESKPGCFYFLFNNIRKLGLEEEAVCFLLRAAMDSPPSCNYQLRSAFTRGSIRGWIYVETTMNKEAQRLLAEAPGLSRGPFNIVKEGIKFDPSDWVALLNLRDFPDPPKAGTWVTVRKGTYKGDVGFVCEDKIGWEGVTVLLVPRISTSFRAGLKQKRLAQPNRPALFNPASVKYLRNPDNDNEEELTQVEDNIFRFRGVTYEHGLVRRKYSLQS